MTLLTIHLVSALSEFALKNYLGDTAAEAVGGGLIDIARKKIEGFADERKTANH